MSGVKAAPAAQVLKDPVTSLQPALPPPPAAESQSTQLGGIKPAGVHSAGRRRGKLGATGSGAAARDHAARQTHMAGNMGAGSPTPHPHSRACAPLLTSPMISKASRGAAQAQAPLQAMAPCRAIPHDLREFIPTRDAIEQNCAPWGGCRSPRLQYGSLRASCGGKEAQQARPSARNTSSHSPLYHKALQLERSLAFGMTRRAWRTWREE